MNSETMQNIIAEFNGNNHAQLAKHYGLRTRDIYKVIETFRLLAPVINKTEPSDYKSHAQQHFDQYRHALIWRHVNTGDALTDVATKFSLTIEQVLDAVRIHEVAMANERHRCALIHYRINAGVRKEQVANDFAMTVEDIELALIKYNIHQKEQTHARSHTST